MKRIMMLAAALAAVAALPAQAAEADTATELRCILLSGRMASAADPQARQGGMMMAFYYLGRLDRKFSAADLQAKLLEAAKTLTADELKAAAKTCGDQLQQRGAFLEDLGNKLTPPAKAGPKE